MSNKERGAAQQPENSFRVLTGQRTREGLKALCRGLYRSIRYRPRLHFGGIVIANYDIVAIITGRI